MTTVANTFASKLAVAFVAIAMMFSLVAPAQAQTAEELQAQIDTLMATITALQAQLGVTTTTGDTMTSSASVCPYTWTRTLNTGATGDDVMKLQMFLNATPATQVAVSGAGSPGNETSYYGPATGAAVAKFQEMYRTDILSPLGLVNSTTFFGNSTMAKANSVCTATTVVDDSMDEEDADDASTLGNSEGDISQIDEVSADESSLEEGQEAGLLAFKAEIEGDVEINRVDFYMDNTAAGTESGDAEDYFKGASLWVDGDKVAELDASDFDEDAYTFDVVVNGTGDEYRLRFSGLGLVFEDGDEPVFQLALEANNVIDSGDQTETWGLDMALDSIRFVDGQGFTDTAGDATVESTFGIDAEELAELRITTSTNDPDATIIEVDDSTDDTDGVEVFVFEVEERNGVDVTVQDLSVTITTTGTTNESTVVNEAHLYNGATLLASEVVVDGGITLFENIDLDIDADDTVELTVKLDFEGVAAYNEGDTVTVAFTDLTDFTDANGNDENDITETGSATSETHELRSEGIRVEVQSADTTVTAVDGATNDIVEFTWVIDIEAFGGEAVYVNSDAAHILAADGSDVEMVYTIDNTGTALTSVNGTISESDADVDAATATSSYSGAYTGETFFKIAADTVGTFTINVSGTNATDSKQVRAKLANIEWTTDFVETAGVTGTAAMNDYTFDLAEESETPYKTVN